MPEANPADDMDAFYDHRAGTLAAVGAWAGELTWADVGFGAVVFAGTLVVNLLLLGIVLLKLPPTYLSDGHVHRGGIARRVVINLVGLALVVLGILTSLPGVPGQGILTIVVGVLLMDVPGKRRLARAVLSRNGMLERINRFRRRFGMAPIVLHGTA